MSTFYLKAFTKKCLVALCFIIVSATSSKAQVEIPIGTGTAGNTGTTYPCPLQDYYEGSRAQYLYLASELSAAGMAPGNINAIKYNVIGLNTFSGDIQNLSVKIGGTTVTTLSTTTWEPGTVEKLFTASFVPVVGTNTLTFSTPFFWNGTDNIIIEICNGHPSNATGDHWTQNPTIPWTTGLSFVASHTYRDDDLGNLCNTATTTNTGLTGNRPNITFDWSPATTCSGKPTAGMATSLTTNICPNQNFTVTLNGATVASGLTYIWQVSPNNTTWSNISGATNAALTTSQTATSWYRAIITCTSGGAMDTSTSVQITSPALVSGTFTINSAVVTGGSNFQNFADAINHIMCGINGPVVFNVAPGSGPYTERVVIPQIGGTSTTNTITINGNGAQITHTTTLTAERAAIHLNGADHIIIDSLNVDVSAGTFGWGIVLTNQADSNIIRKCWINVQNVSSTSTNYLGIAINGSATGTAVSGNNGNGNMFLNNTINGGYWGYYMYGNSGSTTQNINNIIQGNIVTDFYQYGVYSIYQSSGFVVRENDFSRPFRTNSTTTGGVFVTTGSIGVLIEKNKVHNLFDAFTTGTSTTYGIYIGSAGTVASPNRIINNLIYNLGGNGGAYGIYNATSANMQAYHNTISLDGTAATTGLAYGFFQTGTAAGVDFRNNIVNVSRSGTGAKRCILLNTTSSAVISNRNVLFMNASSGTNNNVGQYGTLNFATLNDWKTANLGAYDQQSASADPLFVNPGAADYTPTEAVINDLGQDLGVTTDIIGTPRGTNPDPGAYEFSLPGCTNPPTPGFPFSSSTTVCPNEIFSLNLAGNSIGNGQTYQWQFSSTGAAPWSDVGPLGTSPLFNTSQAVSYYYRCEIKCSGGTAVYSPSIQVLSPTLVSGTFTINSALPNGGGNFQTFGDAVNHIKCGINGPVVFNVAPGSGPYVEQVIIPQINGASTTNTITFNGNGATLVHSPTDATLRTAIIFNGADHITIDSLVVDVSAGTSGWGIGFTAQADSNTIRRCTINVQNVSSTSTNFAGIVFNGSLTTTAISGNNGNGNRIMNNTIVGGYYGVYMYGNSASTTQNNNNYISDNIITDFYNYGVYAIYQSSGLVIRKNDFSRPTRTNSTTTGGVFVTTGSVGVLIEKNKVHNLFDAFTTGTSTTYGIYIGSTGTSTAPNMIVNNLVYNLGGNGPTYGLYNATSAFMLAYHNTISMDGTAATTGLGYGFFQTGTAAGIEFRNNIVHVTRTGTGAKRCILLNTTTSAVVSNRNVLFMNAAAGTNNHIGQYGTTNFTTFTDWQGANGSAYDQQSVNVDPTFFNPASGDYTPNTSLVNNIGGPLGVLTDIRDSLRSTADPDPGAYEFSTLTAGINMSAEGLNAPLVSPTGCYTNAENVTVRIRNNSTQTIDFAVNPVTVTVNVTGAVTQTLMTTLTGGTLASDATLNVTMPTTLDMSTVGVYTFNANTSVTGDVNPANDAIIPVNRTKNALATGSVIASPDTYCSNNGTLPTLSTSGHTGYSGLQWQQSTTSGSGFTNISSGTSSPFATTTPITQTMYYRLEAACGTTSINSPEVIVTYSDPQVTGTNPGYTCGPGTVTLGATGNAGSVINWFDSPSSNTPIATGNTFTTPSISTTTTYYVTAGTGFGSQDVGAPDLSIGANAVVGGYYMNFTVTVPLTIQSVECYFNAIGVPFVLNIRNATTLASVFTFNGTTSASGTTTPQILLINAVLPPGDYQMGWTTDPGTYRNNTGGSYPYTLPGVISITGNTFNNPAFYYYFYRWRVISGCVSAKVPVVATVNNDPGCVPVPVTLLNFKGEKKGTINSLEWTTTTEINNAGFELQRSADGNNFSSLVFVPSKANGGNSTNNLSYNFNDIKPLFGNGYYRLKQIDKDGKFTYSNVVLIKGSKASMITLSSVYPNPAVKDLNLVISSPVAERLSLVITDLTGRVMMQKAVQAVSGDNLFNLQVSNLAAGTYLIKAVCANGCETAIQKFVKQ